MISNTQLPEIMRRLSTNLRDQKYSNLQDKIQKLSVKLSMENDPRRKQEQRQELNAYGEELAELARFHRIEAEGHDPPTTLPAFIKRLRGELDRLLYCRSLLGDYDPPPNKEHADNLIRLLKFGRKFKLPNRPSYPRNPISIDDRIKGTDDLLKAVEAAKQAKSSIGTGLLNQRQKLSPLQQSVWDILNEFTTKYDNFGVPENCLTGGEIAGTYLSKIGIKNQNEKSVGDVICEIRKKGWPVHNQQGQGYFIPNLPEVSRK